MHGKVVSLLSVLALYCSSGPLPHAAAQDFSIHTRVYDLRQAPGISTDGRKGKAPLVSETFSLFHAGKVYDNIPHLDEMLIFEPAEKRFLIVSSSRKVATILSFSDIENVLYRSEKMVQQKFEAGISPQNPKLTGPVKFLIAPSFEESYDAATRDLKLSSQYLSYHVRCAESDSPEIVKSYIQYADWTARLNFLLNPNALLPKPRLTLNEVLQGKNVLPVEVELSATIGAGMHVQATHKYQWRLDTNDRRKIRYWETLLSSRDLKYVSFDEFQQVLTAQASAETKKR